MNNENKINLMYDMKDRWKSKNKMKKRNNNKVYSVKHVN